AIVASGEGNVDDISVTGPTEIYEVRANAVSHRTITPADLGLDLHRADEVVGGDAKENARIFREVLAGEDVPVIRDMIVAQAGAGLYVTGLAASLKDGVKMAIDAIEEGDAAAKVAAFVEVSRRAAGK